MVIQLDAKSLGAVAFGLVMFGIAYNQVIGRMGEHKEGYLAIFVAVGTIITLGAVAIISWQAALLSLGAFICSGVPMIAGDLYRSMRTRADAMKRAQDKADGKA